tara:strand:- start:1621 stop:3657 length:2037 start_codon:yes stop_codon:yes gene_type:complete
MKRGLWIVLTLLLMPSVLAEEGSILDIFLGATDESSVLLKFLYAALVYIIIFKTTKETVFKDEGGKSEQHRFAVMFSLIISLIVMRFTPDVILENFGWAIGLLAPFLVIFFIMRGLTGEKAEDGKWPWKALLLTVIICILMFVGLYTLPAFQGTMSGMPLGYAFDEIMSDVIYLFFFKLSPFLTILLMAALVFGLLYMAHHFKWLEGLGDKAKGGASFKNLGYVLLVILGVALLLFLLGNGGGILAFLAAPLSFILFYGAWGLGVVLLLALLAGLIWLLWKYHKQIGAVFKFIFWDSANNKPRWWLILTLLALILGAIIIYYLGGWSFLVLFVILGLAILAGLLWLLWKYKGNIGDGFKYLFGNLLWDRLLKGRRLRYILQLGDTFVEPPGRSIIGWLATLDGALPLDFFQLNRGATAPFTTRWSRLSGIARMGRRSDRLRINRNETLPLTVGVYEGVSKFMATPGAVVNLTVDQPGMFRNPDGTTTNSVTINTGTYGINGILLQAPDTDMRLRLYVTSVTAENREPAIPHVFEIIVGAGGPLPTPTTTTGMSVTMMWVPEPGVSNRHMLMNFFVLNNRTGRPVNGATITLADGYTNVAGVAMPVNIFGGMVHTTDPSGSIPANLRITLPRNLAMGVVEQHPITVNVTAPGLGTVSTTQNITFQSPGAGFGGPRYHTF